MLMSKKVKEEQILALQVEREWMNDEPRVTPEKRSEARRAFNAVIIHLCDDDYVGAAKKLEDTAKLVTPEIAERLRRASDLIQKFG